MEKKKKKIQIKSFRRIIFSDKNERRFNLISHLNAQKMQVIFFSALFAEYFYRNWPGD